MLSGHVGLQDFIFAKEYKGMMGYKPGACVPALEVARWLFNMLYLNIIIIEKFVNIFHSSPGEVQAMFSQ